MFIFVGMEAIFKSHLATFMGGQPMPTLVYHSSWVSNHRLNSYLASYGAAVENQNRDDEDSDNQTAITETTTTSITTNPITKSMPLKIELSYLFVTLALITNVSMEIWGRYQDYFVTMAQSRTDSA
ncbi:hypothetical protein BGZ96_009261 [Linnemannia gamsii]|uniref:Uncharacterized protein n=1 Tax=Linnemannia gamsii TaxID=64522 RepID=A0ABQ7JXQ6_9FUNG|nr:hypothetical protein BGZ96_009261 [Linnemannia gamsii]